jgi:hypothetical protein
MKEKFMKKKIYLVPMVIIWCLFGVYTFAVEHYAVPPAPKPYAVPPKPAQKVPHKIPQAVPQKVPYKIPHIRSHVVPAKVPHGLTVHEQHRPKIHSEKKYSNKQVKHKVLTPKHHTPPLVTKKHYKKTINKKTSIHSHKTSIRTIKTKHKKVVHTKRDKNKLQKIQVTPTKMKNYQVIDTVILGAKKPLNMKANGINTKTIIREQYDSHGKGSHNHRDKHNDRYDGNHHNNYNRDSHHNTNNGYNKQPIQRPKELVEIFTGDSKPQHMHKSESAQTTFIPLITVGGKLIDGKGKAVKAQTGLSNFVKTPDNIGTALKMQQPVQTRPAPVSTVTQVPHTQMTQIPKNVSQAVKVDGLCNAI